MVTLRATKKLLRRIGVAAPETSASDTALGDWYANRLVVARQPLLILVSSRSLLPILTMARDLRALPERLPEIVAARLRRLGIAESLIDAEVAAMIPVRIAGTYDRSVVGTMVDFAKMIPSYLIIGDHVTTLPFVEAWLAETPCRSSGPFESVVFPDRTAPELLRARWNR